MTFYCFHTIFYFHPFFPIENIENIAITNNSTLSIPSHPKHTTMNFKTRTSFRPSLIIGQILALQSTFYLALALSLAPLCLISGQPFITDYFFYPKAWLNSGTVWGWVLFVHLVGNAVGVAYVLLVLIQRAKLCLGMLCFYLIGRFCIYSCFYSYYYSQYIPGYLTSHQLIPR
jgi:hypothetical protein